MQNHHWYWDLLSSSTTPPTILSSLNNLYPPNNLFPFPFIAFITVWVVFLPQAMPADTPEHWRDIWRQNLKALCLAVSNNQVIWRYILQWGIKTSTYVISVVIQWPYIECRVCTKINWGLQMDFMLVVGSICWICQLKLIESTNGIEILQMGMHILTKRGVCISMSFSSLTAKEIW